MRLQRFRQAGVRAVVLVMLCVLLTPVVVSATPPTTDELNALYNDYPYYDPSLETGNCGADDNTASGAALHGGDNAEKAYNYFRGQKFNGTGLTPVQSAAIIGNLMQESHVNPKSNQAGGPGMGIAQWSNPGRWYNPGNPADKGTLVGNAGDSHKFELGAQLDFVWYEMTHNYLDALKDLQKASGIEDATAAFELKYEAAGSPNMANRIRYAKQALKDFGGDASSDGGGTSVGTASCSDVSGAGGLGINGDFVFPEKTTQSAIKSNKAAVWCYQSQKNCHHDYNAADIFNAVGTTNVAAVSGTVLYTKDPGSCDGWRGVPHLQIKGKDGKFYYYTHMMPGSLVVHGQQHVNAGDPIGKIGPSNCAQGTAPHLHFQASNVEINNTSSSSERSQYLNVQPNLIAAFKKLPEN